MSDINKLEYKDIFLQLHKCVNDPTTRATNSLKKAKLIKNIVTKILEKRENIYYKVKILSKVHKETNVLTNNVLLVLGNPRNGPNAVIMVHHDTVTIKSLDIQSDKRQMYGYGIQDDTIHLSAAIQSIKTVKVPVNGAILYVFTDHEENGCRGSSAIINDLVKLLGTKHRNTLIALESNNNKMALGHRGKYSSKIVGDTDNIFDTFFSFYSFLKTVSDSVYNIHSNSILGRTSGTSTYGEMDSKKIFAILDFRTSDSYSPNKIEKLILKCINKRSLDVKIDVYKDISIFVGNDQILINSNSKISHPSNFNPETDQSVLPCLLCLTNFLHSIDACVEKITWGDKTRQNSIPNTASIKGTFVNFVDQIYEYHKSIAGKSIHIKSRLDSRTYFKVRNQMLTDSVLSPIDKFSNSIVGSATAVNYMTDIAKLFNKLKSKSKNVYGFVYGIGNPLNLHNLEMVDINEANKLPEKILFLISKSLEVSKKKIFIIAPDSYSGNAFNNALKSNNYDTKFYLAKIAPRVISNKINKDPQVEKDLAESLIVANNLGYTNVVIACNTLQFWLPKAIKIIPKEISKNLIITTTFKALEREFGLRKDLLFLGTVVTSKKIKQYPTAYSIKRNDILELTQEIIWRVKAIGKNDISTATNTISKIANKKELSKKVSFLYQLLLETGYKNIVLACTELPIAFKNYIDKNNKNIKFIDPVKLITF